MSASNQLARYDAMCRAIDAAYKVDEVKDIRDKAIAWETYSRQAKNTENERRACEIRLRAERKAGQLLRRMDKAKGARAPGTRRGATRSTDTTASLKDLGISKDQSSKWQQLADASEDDFEAALGDQTAMPTTNGIIRATTPPKVTPVSVEALWLSGRLRDFEEKMLHRDPADVMLTMTDEMQDEVHRLAPLVATWLRRIGKYRPAVAEVHELLKRMAWRTRKFGSFDHIKIDSGDYEEPEWSAELKAVYQQAWQQLPPEDQKILAKYRQKHFG